MSRKLMPTVLLTPFLVVYGSVCDNEYAVENRPEFQNLSVGLAYNNADLLS